MNFPGGTPKAVRVTGPDGKEVPAQISNGKVMFVAKVPSVGYAVYDVQPGAGAARQRRRLQVSANSLENRYYRVKLNADGDVASIFDKSIGKELLAAPARLAISYDNPEQWPAWNMDWDQEQAAPKAYVGGPAQIRVVENGPARVAIEVSRETAGSKFVQTIRLSAGDAGKRVEFGNAIDWNTRESNLKATFPLTASNQMATYNWDIGTIERPTAEPKKFEVPSHQWIDLTDMSGEFGATILTDCKNGSDKPNDHTIRLTLIRTPGTRGGYPDQGTQDIGHHEFVYGIAGHAGGWRQRETDWQGQRLNAPLIAFETSKACGRAGPGVFSAEGQQPAHSGPGAEESRAERRNDRAAGGTRRQAAAGCPRLVRRAHHRRPRSERPGAAGRAGDLSRRRAGDFVHRVSAAHIRREAGCGPDQSRARAFRAGAAAI